MRSTLPCFLAGALPLLAPPSARSEEPAPDAFDPAVLARMDAAVQDAIAAEQLPGGVLWLERDGRSYQQAYGHRSIAPAREPMSLDTIFDAASLTKVIATTPAVVKLVEEGRLGLDDPASKYIPELTGDSNKGRITIRHLLTHTSGLQPGIRRGYEWSGYDHGIALACSEVSTGRAGKDYLYSDINFILLGEIVRRFAKEDLDAFATRHFFGPLGMADTSFRPAPARLPRLAPTTRMDDGTILRGIVHDPTARAMGGVAGHAGLFTTAADLARFTRMILHGGELDGVRVLKPESVALLTTVQSPKFVTARRALGFDLESPYAGPRGKHLPLGSFGHTGWTGTSLWIDPFSRTFVMLLSNRNHPTEEGKVLDLRYQLGSLAAEAVRGFDFKEVPGALPALTDHQRRLAARKLAPPRPAVRNGIDVLAARRFAELKGLKVGLITNHTGQSRTGTSTIDLLHEAPELELVALFAPEHGIRGVLEGDLNDAVDHKTGLPIHSLYAGPDRRKPRREDLQPLDALVFDMQDIGCRYFTYISTMALCMEAAAEAGIRFVVLDRPNPIGGRKVAGPLRVGADAFVATHHIPIQHGMTVGELALLIRAERFPALDLMVVPVEGWTRGMLFDETGLPWIKPSPNMPDLTAALLYPGIGWLEFTDLSVGRGTTLPFELVGAPYLDPGSFAAHLNAAKLPGLQFIPVRFTPAASAFKDQECGGVRVLLKDRESYPAVELGLVLAEALRTLTPGAWDPTNLNTLLRHPATAGAIVEGLSREGILAEWNADLERFAPRREPHLLYKEPPPTASPPPAP